MTNSKTVVLHGSCTQYFHGAYGLFLLLTFLQQGANEKPNDIPGCGVWVFVVDLPLFFEGQASQKRRPKLNQNKGHQKNSGMGCSPSQQFSSPGFRHVS